MAEFTGKPSPFPVDEPLKEKMPADTKILYMQCGSPICQLQWAMVEAAGKAMGVETKQIKAGSQASEVANAFDTAVAEEPDAVLVPAIEPSLFRTQLEELQENGVAVVTSGVVDPQEYGIEYRRLLPPVGRNDRQAAGRQGGRAERRRSGHRLLRGAGTRVHPECSRKRSKRKWKTSAPNARCA